MRNLYWTVHRCFLSSFGSFGQVGSEEIIFLRNRPTRNKNCLCRQCFLTDRDESIDVFYQVSVHLAKRFRRRLKCEKLTDDGHQVIDKSSLCLWQVTRHKPLVEQELLSLPEFTTSEVRVDQSLYIIVCYLLAIVLCVL